MRQVFHQIDVLTFQLDEVIARLEADIREKAIARYLNNEKKEHLSVTEEQL